MKRILEPSGEISKPPTTERLPTLRFEPAVRLIGWPPPTNCTHTSVGPRASDRYATHLPSGEIAGAIPCAAGDVKRKDPRVLTGEPLPTTGAELTFSDASFTESEVLVG